MYNFFRKCVSLIDSSHLDFFVCLKGKTDKGGEIILYKQLKPNVFHI